MSIRLGGLNSGMDTDSMVEALMSAQKYKKTKIEAKKQKLEWQKEIWGEMNTKIYDFYKDSLSKIKMQSTFKTKSAVSSDTSKVKATVSSSASEGTYKVKVNSVASSQYVTSGKLAGALDENGNKVAASADTKLIDLVDANGNKAFDLGTQISVKTADGKGASTVLVDENTTVSSFVNACKSIGLNASFDANQQRFFIGSSKSGEDQGFTITSAALSSDQLNAVSDWKKAVGYEYLSTEDMSSVSNLFSGLQAGTITYDEDVENELKSYITKSQETGVTSYYRKQLTDSYNGQYFSDDTQETVTDAGKQALIDSGKTQEEIDAMSATDLASAVKSLVSTKVSGDLATDEYKDKISAGITGGIAGADSFLSASSTQRENTILNLASTYKNTMSNTTDNSSQLKGIGLGSVTGAAVSEGSDSSGMVVIAASDASVTFNGATLTSSNSTLSVNGLTLELLSETAGSEISITVSKDTSAVYDTIKDFITEYNSILTSMSTKYNAASAKSYDILTDDMKEDMSEDEIEKWNDKIKSSLLRKDDTLSSIMTSFRSVMTKNITTSNGKTYSLANLGITTSTDYTEGGLLHIKGDEDDDEYGDETNKLMELLSEDPDSVMEVITGVATSLYEDLTKKMASTKLSSAFTFYNDKQMTTQLNTYKKEISEWETKLSDMEDRYYSQFTAMEKAMANLNSQQNSLSGFFG